MKYGVLGEFSHASEPEIGWMACSAHELAKAGFPVPYGLVLAKSVFEEFLVESGIVGLFFSLMKKGQKDKACSLISSTPFPASMEEEVLSLLESHNMRLFDAHCSSQKKEVEYHVYGQRRTHLSYALRSCWAAAVTQGEFSSAVVIMRHVGAEKTGKLYTQHPLNNSRAYGVISLVRPQNATFFVNVATGEIANPKDFHRIDSPLLVEEKDALIPIIVQGQMFSQKPVVLDWLLGQGAYVLAYRELNVQDRAQFLSHATSSSSR